MKYGDRYPRLRKLRGHQSLAERAIPDGFGARLGPDFARPAPPGKLRVGIFSVCDGVGGAEQWVSHLLDLCDRDRIHWVGVALKHPTPGGPTLRADWERTCPVASGAGAIRDLAARVDVLVAWGVIDQQWGMTPAALEALIPRGLPVVLASHGSLPYPGPDPVAHLIRATDVAVSPAALRMIAPSRRAKARVILNQVSPDRVIPVADARERIRARHGIPPDGKLAGYLGRLSAEKGPKRFIDGIAALPAGWSGLMAGGSWKEAEDDVRRYAAEVAPGRVIFAGVVDHPGDLLAAFDCLVMTSETEACSIAAAEAWLAGCPLVSTPVGLLEDRPELAKLIPSRLPSGDQVATAILDDRADDVGRLARVELARDFARVEMGPGTFGGAWSDLIASLARPRAEDAQARLAMLAELCPHGSGPCGCGSGPPRLCGHPDRPLEVRRADCLRCQARTWWESGVDPAA